LWRRPRPKLGCGAKERRRFYITSCSLHILKLHNKYRSLFTKMNVPLHDRYMYDMTEILVDKSEFIL